MIFGRVVGHRRLGIGRTKVDDSSPWSDAARAAPAAARWRCFTFYPPHFTHRPLPYANQLIWFPSPPFFFKVFLAYRWFPRTAALYLHNWLLQLTPICSENLSGAPRVNKTVNCQSRIYLLNLYCTLVTMETHTKEEHNLIGSTMNTSIFMQTRPFPTPSTFTTNSTYSLQ